MLNEVKPNLDLLMSIRLGLAEQYGIPLDVPFRDYKAWYRWTGMEVPTQTMRADFVNQLYSKEGKPCRFEDIFEFERLSKAWIYLNSQRVEFESNSPRFTEEGLLLEPQSTNFLKDSFLSTGLVGFDVVSENAVTGEDNLGVYVNFLQQPATASAYKFYANRNEKDGSHSISALLNKTNLELDGVGSANDGSLVGSIGDVVHLHGGVYHGCAAMENLGSGGLHRGIVKYSHNSDVAFKLYALQVEPLQFSTSFIKTDKSPTTRLKDELFLKIPQGHTITGDWDDTLHLFERDGQLDFEGYGYIRTLEMIPMEGSYTADFTKDAIISHTGFEHRGIFGRGIFEFERLSKAWDFVDGELKEYEVGEARFSEKGMLVEPESTNYLLHNINLTAGAWSSGGELATLTPIGYGMFKVSPDGRLVHYAVVSEIDGEEATASCYIADASTPITMSSRRMTGGVYIGGIVSDGDITPYGGSTHSVHRKGVQFGYSKTTLSTGAGYSSWQLQQTTEPYVVSCPQWELGLQMTSGILTDTTPVTRLPETITHPTTLEFLSIDKDEGILHEDGVFSGFGYIRKIEVKV